MSSLRCINRRLREEALLLLPDRKLFCVPSPSSAKATVAAKYITATARIAGFEKELIVYSFLEKWCFDDMGVTTASYHSLLFTLHYLFDHLATKILEAERMETRKNLRYLRRNLLFRVTSSQKAAKDKQLEKAEGTAKGKRQYNTWSARGTIEGKGNRKTKGDHRRQKGHQKGRQKTRQKARQKASSLSKHNWMHNIENHDTTPPPARKANRGGYYPRRSALRFAPRVPIRCHF